MSDRAFAYGLVLITLLFAITIVVHYGVEPLLIDQPLGL